MSENTVSVIVEMDGKQTVKYSFYFETYEDATAVFGILCSEAETHEKEMNKSSKLRRTK